MLAGRPNAASDRSRDSSWSSGGRGRDSTRAASSGPYGHPPPPVSHGSPQGYGQPPPPPHAPPPQRGNSASLIIGIIAGVLALFVLAGGVAAAIFRRPVPPAVVIATSASTAPPPLPPKMASNAHDHVPAGCQVLLRLDVMHALAVPSVAKHLGPALDGLRKSRAKNGGGDVLQELDLAPRTDIKEVALCLAKVDTEGTPRYAITIGGNFRPESVVAAFEKLDDPKPVVTFFEDRKVAATRDDRGEEVVIGQAADGAIVLANDRAWLESAERSTSAEAGEYGLPLGDEASAVVAKSLVTTQLGAKGPNPLTLAFAPVTRIALSIALTRPGGEVRFATPKPADATRLLGTLNTLLLPALKEQLGPGPSEVGETEALLRTKARVDGSNVVVDVPWSADGLEKLAAKLAAAMSAAKL